MTDIIQYKPGHLDFIEPLDCYPKEAREMAADNAECVGATYTLVANNSPMAVVGCTKNGHTLSVWAFAGKKIKEWPLFYHKSLKFLIDGNVEALNIKRVQSLVACDNTVAVRQLKSLGFEVEAKCVMSGCGGEDEYILRRLV